jgi:hypothetical protein
MAGRTTMDRDRRDRRKARPSHRMRAVTIFIGCVIVVFAISSVDLVHDAGGNAVGGTGGLLGPLWERLCGEVESASLLSLVALASCTINLALTYTVILLALGRSDRAEPRSGGRPSRRLMAGPGARLSRYLRELRAEIAYLAVAWPERPNTAQKLGPSLAREPQRPAPCPLHAAHDSSDDRRSYHLSDASSVVPRARPSAPAPAPPPRGPNRASSASAWPDAPLPIEALPDPLLTATLDEEARHEDD